MLLPSQIDWSPGTATGVLGGIPTRTTETPIILNSGQDAATALNAAIALSKKGDVLKLPSGTFPFGVNVSIPSSKSGITVRGAADGSTILEVQPNVDQPFSIGTGYSFNYPANGVPVVAGNKKGSTFITLPSTEGFTVGSMALIMFEGQQDDVAIEAGAVPIVSVVGFNYKENQSGLLQLVEIKAKTNSTLTIFPPILRQNDEGLAAKVFLSPWSNKDIGLENLTIECGKGVVFAGVSFKEAMGCWLKNVRVYNASNYGVYLQHSLNCEMRGCDIRNRKGDGSNGAGLLVNGSTACLFEDNIVADIFPCVEVNQGSIGNVFGYSVFENAPKNIYGGRFLFDTLVANHGPHNCLNLYEGNITANIKWDGYFGGASEDTVFRNWIHGSHKDREMYTYITSINRFAREMTLAGNLLMTPGHPHSNPYSFGNPNMGNSSFTGEASPLAGKFWIDWKTAATLVERTSENSGKIEVSAGGLHKDTSESYPQYLTLRLADGTQANQVQATAQVDKVITFRTSAQPLPPVGTKLQIWWGSGGYQEKDLDVEKTTALIENKNLKTGMVPLNERLPAGEVLPDSLYRTSKPSWFGDKAWPPFATEGGYDRTPAGERFLKGQVVVEPPPVVVEPPPVVVEPPPVPVVDLKQVMTETLDAIISTQKDLVSKLEKIRLKL